ncbi:hypothetical protein KY290_035430 [Solanum tuberosum]|uniref:DDE Tnp4 domain-containing protein n=1 Tax=Solanum tuberosum TaxID=4113 RepID=A0ABQ7U622_SOLTU|nr:hypothetical protein KY289_034191 [Solanum tuberosum]KAH0643218.1 hypothetical protein KY289_034192 [Solanum tuberosum]KAH0742387.1 hypothetical protein KY290_035430 [Solanum tuberosum]
MDRNSFHTLVLLTKEVGGLTDSKYMSSSEKLAMFLNILAHHEKNRSIKVDYIRSGWSVSQAFNECLKVILKLAPLLLVNPKPVLEDELDDRWRWFKGCLGALDGTYIQIRVPSKGKPRYRTRKGEIATNVLGVCDKNLNFTYVLPGWEGSAADGRVLRNAITRTNGLKIPEGNYYLCDGGYTNGNGFLSPYRGYRYWLRDWQGENPPPQCREELFNMKHARARNVIERTFGLLKGRWGILRSPSWYSVKIHNRIISACCLIHNFIRREMEVDPLEIDVEEQVEYQQNNIDVVESSQEWTTWRDELAQSIKMEIQKSSMQPPKRSKRRRSTPSTRRTWTPTEESTLINGLKELCVNGWRADNGTFRPGYLMELEDYLHEHHPESGLKGEPHVNSKLKFWKRCYASLSLLKGRSGLGFQYSDGTIIIDDPKEWDKFLKDDPGASNMNTKKWPLFADWEEIFGKDRATGEHAEGPLDVVEDILKSQTSRLSTDMSLGFLINVDDDEYEDEASHGPNAPAEEAENTDTRHNFTQTTENEYARGSPHEHTGPSEKQGEYAKTSSSSVNEKEKGKKRKRVVEDVNETFLKSMAEVMKFFTESQDKRIGSLIEKIGNRDHSDMRGQIYSIIESPTFDLYTIEQRIKAKKVICEDVKNMEIFLRMGELERHTMMFMVVNDKL